MERSVKNKIVIIGAGNVATHLAQAFSHEFDVVQVYNHNIDNAIHLATKLHGCEAINDLSLLNDSADVYVLSIKDDAIKEIVAQIPDVCKTKLWVHTSGSVSMDVFKGVINQYGVLYPLQTFSKDVDVNVGEIPFFIEGNEVASLEKIKEVALRISPIVKIADSDSRKRIHASAVFACNFVNHLWSIADDILKKGNLEFELLIPLLKETLAKIAKVSPCDAQTGPARRGDVKTMMGHMALLEEDQKEIYRLLSRSIMKQYNIPIDE